MVGNPRLRAQPLCSGFYLTHGEGSGSGSVCEHEKLDLCFPIRETAKSMESNYLASPLQLPGRLSLQASRGAAPPCQSRTLLAGGSFEVGLSRGCFLIRTDSCLSQKVCQGSGSFFRMGQPTICH